MIAATVCSGIGAPEVAMPQWQYSFQSEIENFPREVLKVRQHAQDARYKRGSGPALWGDFTAIRVRFLRRLGIALPQWLIAGTPCQAFSVAGLRQSLADDRGNLTLEFVRLVHALRRAGSLRGFTWENVPGVLSTKDNAFGCFLAAAVGADAPLLSPLEQGRWPDAGMVAGPWARVAWRILDAQYCGLAQRRRRVILVADFGDWIDPAAVLFERHSLSGDTPPRRETRESVAALTANGVGTCGADDNQGQAGHLVPWPAKIAPTLNAAFGSKLGLEDQHINGGAGCFVPVAFVQNQRDEVREVPVAGALAAEPGMKQQTYIAFSAKDHGADAQDNLSPTLRARGHSGSHANVGVMPAVLSFGWQNSPSQGDGVLEDAVPTLDKSKTPAVLHSAVRRLTPRECERLQGFPDDYTLIPYRGKPAADGPRYKALGNSMAVPVMAWIGQRVAAVEALQIQAEAA